MGDRAVGYLALATLIVFWAGAAVLVAVLAYPYVVRLRHWPAFSAFLLQSKQGLSDVRLVYEEPLDPSKPTLIVLEPHGVFCLGPVLNGLFAPERRALVSCVLHSWPGFQYLIGWTRCVVPCDAATVRDCMARGETLCLMPGGVEEAVLTRFGCNSVRIAHKKGFVKLALQYGYSLAPAYTFGETRTYKCIGALEALRLWVARRGLPFVLPVGLWGTLLPLDARLTTVVGRPIELPRLSSPSPQEVSAWHAVFVARLVELFDRHKEAAGERDSLLEYGYSLAPAYTFGETRTYKCIGALEALRLWVARRGLPFVLPVGLWGTLLPLDARLTTVVGRPIELPRLSSPSPQEVSAWHAVFVARLVELFDRHKEAAGERDSLLEVS
eukprot:m51a1_g1176 putative diacylglycerol acyltransferase family protein (383) ;mRNA; r:382570-384312